MIDERMIESVRRMTPAERLRLGLDLMNFAWRFLDRLPIEERQRRLDLARRPWRPPPLPMEEE
jgi:hypothetical protein